MSCPYVGLDTLHYYTATPLAEIRLRLVVVNRDDLTLPVQTLTKENTVK